MKAVFLLAPLLRLAQPSWRLRQRSWSSGSADDSMIRVNLSHEKIEFSQHIRLV
jgi:hypothetical protein